MSYSFCLIHFMKYLWKLDTRKCRYKINDYDDLKNNVFLKSCTKINVNNICEDKYIFLFVFNIIQYILLNRNANNPITNNNKN